MADRTGLIGRLDSIRIPWPLMVRMFLGGYFIYAGINKAVEPHVFLKGVRLYGALPETPPVFLNGTAVWLPWVEIVCGAALVLGLCRRGASALVALLMCVFTPAIIGRTLSVMQERSLSFFAVEFDCGCGTGAEIIWIKLCKNLGLFLLAGYLLISRYQAVSFDALIGAGAGAPGVCRKCGSRYDELGRCGCRSSTAEPALAGIASNRSA